MRWQPIPQQRGLLSAEELPQLAQDFDEGVGVVIAGRDVESELGATAAHAIADRRSIEAFFQLNGCVNVGAWPLGAQLRRTLGVRLSADSSKRPDRLCAVGHLLDRRPARSDPAVDRRLVTLCGTPRWRRTARRRAADGPRADHVVVVPQGGEERLASPDPHPASDPVPIRARILNPTPKLLFIEFRGLG
jgi:hypothetical protein